MSVLRRSWKGLRALWRRTRAGLAAKDLATLRCGRCSWRFVRLRRRMPPFWDQLTPICPRCQRELAQEFAGPQPTGVSP